jgi:ketosteroid isomerase-like protein
MGEKENHHALEQLLDAVHEQQFDAAEKLYHEDAVVEWPQSGERIKGKNNIRAVNDNYPGFPKTKVSNIRVAGDLGIAEAELDYDGKIYRGVSIVEFEDGKIRKQTDYFSEPFEAPEWRTKWVEKI